MPKLVPACLAAFLVTLCDTNAADGDRQPDPPLGVVGVVKHHPRFPSKLVEPRNVDVWLPPSYEKDAAKRYPVLYMHDGQNLFDPKTSFLRIDWAVDETMTRLIEEGRIQEAIVVGVWNTPKRMQEYLPQKMITTLSPEKKEQLKRTPGRRAGISTEEKNLLADKYLQFLVAELKPYIDKEYRTRPDRANTFLMGSSGGAMISIYAIAEYPDVFGGAGCVSTHWPFADGLLVEYMKDRLPDPAMHKIYFDFGTETLDKGYEPYQAKMDEAMKAKGYAAGKNWLTCKYTGDEHSERAWRRRMHVPILFFFGKN